MDTIWLTNDEAGRIRAEERERCARLIEDYTAPDLLLAAGEMTNQEMRTVRAMQAMWINKIRNLK